MKTHDFRAPRNARNPRHKGGRAGRLGALKPPTQAKPACGEGTAQQTAPWVSITCTRLRMPFLAAHISERHRSFSAPKMLPKLERIVALPGPACLDTQVCIHVLRSAA